MSMAMDIPIPTQEGDHIHVPAPLSSSTTGPGYGGGGGSGGGGGGHGMLHHHHHHDPMSHVNANNSPGGTAINGPLEDHHVAMVGYNNGGKSGGGGNKAAVRYRECLKNHAAAMGGTAMDGCGEFMPSGEEGTIEALTCSACGCHRNFHRKESEGSAAAGGGGGGHVDHPLDQWYHHHLHSPPHLNRVGRKVIVGHPHHKGMMGGHEATAALLYPTGTLIASRGPTPHQMIMPYSMAGSLPSESDHEQEEEDHVHMHPGSGGGGGGLAVVARPTQMVKKRFRTKFTPEQKEKMMSFAEKVGWKIQRTEESVVQQFCQEIGVKRRVLKVWMHNNKHSLNAKKMMNANTDLNPPPSINNNPNSLNN